MSQSVDDLYISLTIKEGGKLDKLRKQLKAIVGDKGEKKFKIDLGTATKSIGNDVVWIKNRIKFLLPTETPGKTRPFAMRETASIVNTLIAKATRSYAKRIKPLKLNDITTLMSELGAETEDQLIDGLESKLKDWQLYIEMIMKGLWADDNAQKFMNRLRTLIHGKDMPKGKRLSLMREIQAAVGEGNKMLANLFTAKGIPAIAEVWVSRISKDLFRSIFQASEQGLRESGIDFFEAFKIQDEDLKTYINDMWSKQRAEGTSDIIEKFSKKYGYAINEIWKGITTKEIKEDEKLRALALLMFRHMGIEKGKPGLGMPISFEKGIYEAYREYRTKVGSFVTDPEKREKFKNDLTKSFEERFGRKSTEKMFTRKRIDFLFYNIQEHVGEIEDLLGTEVMTYLSQFDSSFAELKNILSETNREQFRFYQKLTGRRLIGIAAMVMDSFTRLKLVETVQLNIMSELEKAGAIKALTDVEKQAIREEAGKELTTEKKESELKKYLGAKSDEAIELIKKVIKLTEEEKTESETSAPGAY